MPWQSSTGRFHNGLEARDGAIEFLACVAGTIRERGEDYGDALPLFTAVARRWSVTLGFDISPAQVAICLIDLKLARLS